MMVGIFYELNDFRLDILRDDMLTNKGVEMKVINGNYCLLVINFLEGGEISFLFDKGEALEGAI